MSSDEFAMASGTWWLQKARAEMSSSLIAEGEEEESSSVSSEDLSESSDSSEVQRAPRRVKLLANYLHKVGFRLIISCLKTTLEPSESPCSPVQARDEATTFVAAVQSQLSALTCTKIRTLIQAASV